MVSQSLVTFVLIFKQRFCGLQTSWNLPKLRHPAVGKLLVTNLLFFPLVCSVLVLSALIESPLVVLFTLPLFVVGYPRPRHGHPELGAASKGIEGLFYRTLTPSLFQSLVSTWRNDVLTTSPGSMIFCRSHERLGCVVRVLGAGLGWVQVELRGLEMQEPTSCHHVEAGWIDKEFSHAFEGDKTQVQRDREESVDITADFHLFIMRPVCKIQATTYEQTILSMCGILDHPKTLLQLHRLFLKTLMWVMAQHLESEGFIPRTWLTCPCTSRDAQGVLNVLRTSSWTDRIASTFAQSPLSPNRVRPSNGSVLHSPEVSKGTTDLAGWEGWSEQARRSIFQVPSVAWVRTSPETTCPMNTASLTPPCKPVKFQSGASDSLVRGESYPRPPLRTLHQTPPVPPPQDSRDDGSDSEEDNLDRLIDMVLDFSPGQQVREKLKPLPLALGPKTVVVQDFGQVHGLPGTQDLTADDCDSLPVSPPPWCATSPCPIPQTSPCNVTPGSVNPPASGPEMMREHSTVNFIEELDWVSRLTVQCYVAVNVAATFGQRPETLGPMHIIRVLTGKWLHGGRAPELQWLQEHPDLNGLTVKALHYAIKITVDCTVMAEETLLDDEDLEAHLKELDRDWFLGDPDSVEWHDAMKDRRPCLMTLRRNGCEYQLLRLALRPDDVRIGALRPEVVQSIWASQSLELRYFTNDDDERYSIQAHRTLLRNMVVQSAEYPIYVSPPTTVWL